MGDLHRNVLEERADTVRWWHKAAAQGHTEASLRMGQYGFGFYGNKSYSSNKMERIFWLQWAAENGNVEARFLLGMTFENRAEEAVLRYKIRYLVTAHMWFNLSSVGGMTEGKERRAKVAELMPREQIAHAQSIAKEWLQDPTNIPDPVFIPEQPTLSTRPDPSTFVAAPLGEGRYDKIAAEGLEKVTSERHANEYREFKAEMLEN